MHSKKNRIGNTKAIRPINVLKMRRIANTGGMFGLMYKVSCWLLFEVLLAWYSSPNKSQSSS